MVSLLSKRQDDVEMYMILHSNDDSVGEAFTNGIDSLRRGGTQILPCSEDEGLVYVVKFCEMFLCLGTRFCDSNDFAVFRTCEGVSGICLTLVLGGGCSLCLGKD
jgi:hypothetical protein